MEQMNVNEEDHRVESKSQMLLDDFLVVILLYFTILTCHLVYFCIEKVEIIKDYREWRR